MKARPTYTTPDDLRDSVLTDLLREAYTDDPALAEAPGRSDRIMRAVMASGVRPRFSWAPLAWAAGTVATAAAAVVLAFSLQQPARLPDDNRVAAPAPHVEQTTQAAVPTDDPVVAAQPKPAPLPTVTEQPRPAWIAPRPTPKAVPAPPPTDATSPAPADEPTYMAADLYAAASTAHAAGDYETAYAAYQASYEMVPTPDALLASAAMLQRMAEEETATNG